jgi:hypothetical protein
VEVNETFTFNAPAELVYNDLTDPDRADRWLPAGMRITRANGGRVGLLIGDRRIDLDVSTAPEDMRLTVRSLDPLPFEGTAQVQEGGAGGSQVHVVVSAGRSGPDPATIRDLVDRAMGQLRRELDDDLAPG